MIKQKNFIALSILKNIPEPPDTAAVNTLLVHAFHQSYELEYSLRNLTLCREMQGPLERRAQSPGLASHGRFEHTRLKISKSQEKKNPEKKDFYLMPSKEHPE